MHGLCDPVKREECADDLEGVGYPLQSGDDLTRAWGQAFWIPKVGRGRAQASIGMSCQPIAGCEREMFSAGCGMTIGSNKLRHEVASTFWGAQVRFVTDKRRHSVLP